MSFTSFLRSRPSLWMAPAGVGLLCCAVLPMSSQTQPAPPAAKTQAVNSAVQYDPTKPEVQPNLTADHDPVISPDAADNLPTGTEVPTVANGRCGGEQPSLVPHL